MSVLLKSVHIVLTKAMSAKGITLTKAFSLALSSLHTSPDIFDSPSPEEDKEEHVSLAHRGWAHPSVKDCYHIPSGGPSCEVS